MTNPPFDVVIAENSPSDDDLPWFDTLNAYHQRLLTLPHYAVPEAHGEVVSARRGAWSVCFVAPAGAVRRAAGTLFAWHWPDRSGLSIAVAKHEFPTQLALAEGSAMHMIVGTCPVHLSLQREADGESSAAIVTGHLPSGAEFSAIVSGPSAESRDRILGSMASLVIVDHSDEMS